MLIVDPLHNKHEGVFGSTNQQFNKMREHAVHLKDDRSLPLRPFQVYMFWAAIFVQQTIWSLLTLIALFSFK